MFLGLRSVQKQADPEDRLAQTRVTQLCHKHSVSISTAKKRMIFFSAVKLGLGLFKKIKLFSEYLFQFSAHHVCKWYVCLATIESDSE